MFHLWALRYNVRFSPEHAYFGYVAVEFLGHRCSKAGKEISESRMTALTSLIVNIQNKALDTFLDVSYLLQNLFLTLLNWLHHLITC